VADRVLIVDDDVSMVETLSDIVRLQGWEADGVHSGEKAIEALRREPYSVVLMDVRMQGMDGVAALKIIRGEFPDLPILLMTAHTTRQTILEAERAGAVRIFPKPVEPTVLLQSLQLALDRRSASEN
jgi:DNA-binding NtrC family response regulator